jgi:hypothetical protein
MKFGRILVILAALVAVNGNSSNTTTTSTGTAGENLFVDSALTYYEGYQQAWRYLGWYVKCGSPSDRYSNQHHGSHSADSGSEEEINHYCQRYLIWAAVSVLIVVDFWLSLAILTCLLIILFLESTLTRTIKVGALESTHTITLLLNLGTTQLAKLMVTEDVLLWIATRQTRLLGS